jgi:NAD(P)-dependent dehydrogenase (short-subunit alcohol dehydrogenase family)
MGFQGRTIVITGGVGGLGSAVVEAVLAAGGICHVPYRGDAARGPRGHERLTLHPGIDLTDEGAVEAFYRKVPNLWASIHIAGGFAFGPVAAAGKSVLASQIEMNLVTCYLCCRSAVTALRQHR